MRVIKEKNKREKILQAAITVLSEKGLEKTKISDIVKEAGVAQGTFYLYFPSKNALIPAIADSMFQKSLEKIKEKIDDNTSFFHQLEDIIDITFQVTAEYREVLALCYSGLAITGVLQEWEKIYEPYYNWIEERIIIAQNKKEIRDDMNSRIIAKLLIELIEGTAEQVYLFEEDEKNASDYHRELLSFIKHSFAK
ncbi:TetR family transcriptional regulator [Natronincola ferrireducens]|uniref:TetR family transcriptional regulator n=1 Tax=Natronincola ferrireducens TaxID=393762 RepID=UPI001AD92AE8|nr:TetR family transcriptional regulator [Natronincola ferrireducens]